MSHYKFAVVEHYTDGGTWIHYYLTREDAELGVELLTEAHGGRTYEIVKVSV